MLLINKHDIAKYVQITGKRNDDMIEQFIREAQEIDLRNLLCENYYNKLLLNISEFSELLKGGSYVWQDETYLNDGLKKVLVYFAYARYVKRGSYTDTAFGMVTKNNQNSQEVGFKEKKEQYTYYRQMAMTYWENVKKFLVRENYKNYNNICSACNSSSGVNSWKMNIISN